MMFERNAYLNSNMKKNFTQIGARLLVHSGAATVAGLMMWQTATAQVTALWTNSYGFVPQATTATGNYYNGLNFNTLIFRGSDPNIEFNWGIGSPDNQFVWVDNFSVRWTGRIVPPYTENYTFSVNSDDGCRVYVNGQLIIDAWFDHQFATTQVSSPIPLAAGSVYSIQVDYYEKTGSASMHLDWSSPSMTFRPVRFQDAPDGTESYFGSSLASLGGGEFAVGAPQADPVLRYFPVTGTYTYTPDGGITSIYDQTGFSLSTLTGVRNGLGRNYGVSLTGFSDGRLLVGSIDAITTSGTTYNNVGELYLNNSAGGFIGVWTNPAGSTASDTYFGHTVSTLYSNMFAASSLATSGSVYLYDSSQTNGPVLATITNPNPTSVIGPTPPHPWSWKFGSALAGLGTNRLMIGAPLDSNNSDGAGSVYIYDYSGTFIRKIHNPTGKAELFGSSLAVVDDHKFLIGAPNASVTYFTGQLITNTTAGLVYLYDDTGSLIRTFTNTDVSVSGSFGAAISMLGPGRVLIGSPGDKAGNLNGVGRVHLFNLDGVRLEHIDNPAGASGDAFGAALCAIDEHRFVVGAPNDDTVRRDAGSIYGFDAPLPVAELGAEIPRPANLDSTGSFPVQGPTVSPAGAAFWHALSQKLFAVKPGGILVSWPLQGGGTYNWQATVGWPTNDAKYQVHVSGQTPVDLGASAGFSNAVLEATTTDANASVIASTRIFSAQNPGTSFLMLSAGDPASNAIRFQLVRTISWSDPAHLYDNAPATIGQPVSDPGGFHDPAAGSPQVVLSNSVYCPAPVFNPATRTGTIIPVNKNNPANPADDLVVAYYQRGTLLFDAVTGLTVSNNIYWPYKPVRFAQQWPTNAPHLVIASQLGTGAIDPAQYVKWQLYYQNDPNQPGFNPNDEHALRLPVAGGEAVFAIRNDLGTPSTSDPFVLIRYQDPSAGNQWRMKVWQVVTEEAPWFFNYPAQAGLLLQPPLPLSVLAPAPPTTAVSGPWWRDRKQAFWARAAGDDGGPADIVMHYFYPVQPSFFFPGANPPPVGVNVPLLDLAAGTPGTPIDVHFTVIWPANLPQLRVAETLVKPKFGLPDISSQSSAEIVYQQSLALSNAPSVKLIDPTHEWHVNLAQLPADVTTASDSGVKYFPTLPPQLRTRFFWDPTTQRLKFVGQFVQPVAGEYYLLLNVITAREKAVLLGLSTDATFQAAVNALYTATTNITEVLPNALGFDSMALTAGEGRGVGYVTLAFGNNPSLSPPAEPISLAVIKVTCPTYQGEIKVIQSDNPFDEKLTLRHSGDFAGKADSYILEWRSLPPVNGLPSTNSPDQWVTFSPTPATGQGAVDITIQGAGLFTISDNYFICRYRPTSASACGTGWSDWTAPQLAEGWIKRVTRGINPFEQRVQNYDSTAVNTIVSMISQAGPPFQGAVPLNQQAANQLGLIEAYETVLRRGQSLSVDGAPPVNYGPANQALLLAAGRLADLYMLLGNEAYADSQDPTIAFGTDDHVYGAEATSIHCFMNQTASLAEEELDLLRGRDDSLLPSVQTPPFYNRLIWNFTSSLDGGEVAYALNYNIRAQDGSVSGTISEADARALYPQGHGDAWGHYLSAIKNYYRLLRNANFTWVPQSEAVLVGGVPVSVDFYDERKFAAAAAARAQAGAEIVNLTYRSAYVEDAAGQWQGYRDSNTNRAWGLSEWGSRAGQGAYFDWVAGNALLPDVDPDQTHTGIRKIDRTTVTQLRDIAAAYGEIQTKVDQADSGLNPLGLAKNVVPFDIDPTLISQGKTHFEQIYDRAVVALNNAITVFNRANNSTQLLRRQADTISDFTKNVADKEVDFNNRLIEVFGYPYAEDIGPTGAYPTGYNGPDLYHYDYVESSAITGQADPPSQTFTALVYDIGVGTDGRVTNSSTRAISFNISSQSLGLVKPPGWTQRRAPGQVQMARSDVLQGLARFQKANVDYNNLIGQIEDRAALLRLQHNVAANQIRIMNQNEKAQQDLNQRIEDSKRTEQTYQLFANGAGRLANALVEAVPREEGLAFDAFSAVRGAIRFAEIMTVGGFEDGVQSEQWSQLVYEHDKEIASLQEQIDITTDQNSVALENDLQQLVELVRQESSARLELFNQVEALQQLAGRYRSALAAGERLLEDRLRFRQETAAQVQQYRYKDMAFRIFRNDALQKYRAQFDLAAMYVYLAARAYDYETNLRKNDPRGPGTAFMTGIIRSRALGLIESGLPQTGSGNGDAGLADPMARMNLNWTLVLKGQLGFNNPQTETGRFSLRSELFRIQAGSAGSKVWRDTLTRSVVDNLLLMPEFKRFCIPFQPQLPVEPAIVIPFSTSINFGQNFFGWPLGGGDNNYDSTHFATKVRSVGVWFANYNNVSLASTPHVYLIPVGEDVMRSPSANVGDVRQWRILDQALPVPFPLSGTSLSDPAWIPSNDSFLEPIGNIRLFPEFRAYTDSGTFDPTQVISNNRLIGRSVWNTRWVLIIPAGELLSDRNEGLQRFINGALLPNGQRDGNGITDIRIFFQTYAYSGN
jgi:hypothetical protein